MCSPKPPKQTTVAPAPPVETPQPLALPDDSSSAMNLSQLRIGSRNNLKLQSQSGGGLAIPKAT